MYASVKLRLKRLAPSKLTGKVLREYFIPMRCAVVEAAAGGVHSQPDAWQPVGAIPDG